MCVCVLNLLRMQNDLSEFKETVKKLYYYHDTRHSRRLLKAPSEESFSNSQLRLSFTNWFRLLSFEIILKKAILTAVWIVCILMCNRSLTAFALAQCSHFWWIFASAHFWRRVAADWLIFYSNCIRITRMEFLQDVINHTPFLWVHNTNTRVCKCEQGDQSNCWRVPKTPSFRLSLLNKLIYLPTHLDLNLCFVFSHSPLNATVVNLW